MRKQERNELVERLIRLRDEFRRKGNWATCDLLADACNELEKMPESAEPDSCEYWDSESHFCALRRPQAEPIVRCKDCVDWVRNFTDRAKPNVHPCRAVGHPTTADFFCGLGERMDGGNNG